MARLRLKAIASKCRRRDSNSHALRQQVLNLPCIPISPLRLVKVELRLPCAPPLRFSAHSSLHSPFPLKFLLNLGVPRPKQKICNKLKSTHSKYTEKGFLSIIEDMKSVINEVKQNILDLTGSVIGWVKKTSHHFGEDNHSGRLLIFIPGYTLWHNPIVPGITDALQAEGYDVAVFNPGQTLQSNIRALSQDLHEFIKEVCKKKGKDKVFLVAHSMGGVIARYTLEKFDKGAHIQKIVAVGSPFHGTRSAYLALHTRAARMMKPNADFVQELNTLNDFTDRIVSIRAKRDQTIWPTSSSYLEGAKNYVVPVIGHNSVRDSKEVVEIVKKELK